MTAWGDIGWQKSHGGDRARTFTGMILCRRPLSLVFSACLLALGACAGSEHRPHDGRRGHRRLWRRRERRATPAAQAPQAWRAPPAALAPRAGRGPPALRAWARRGAVAQARPGVAGTTGVAGTGQAGRGGAAGGATAGRGGAAGGAAGRGGATGLAGAAGMGSPTGTGGTIPSTDAARLRSDGLGGREPRPAGEPRQLRHPRRRLPAADIAAGGKFEQHINAATPKRFSAASASPTRATATSSTSAGSRSVSTGASAVSALGCCGNDSSRLANCNHDAGQRRVQRAAGELQHRLARRHAQRHSWWNTGGASMLWSGGNEDAPGAALHEGGHGFHQLADEYGTCTGASCGSNTNGSGQQRDRSTPRSTRAATR